MLLLQHDRGRTAGGVAVLKAVQVVALGVKFGKKFFFTLCALAHVLIFPEPPPQLEMSSSLATVLHNLWIICRVEFDWRHATSPVQVIVG